jgi:phage baseplate assembly protein W
MSRIEEAYLVDLEFKGDFATKPGGDFETITGIENLKQALFHRLITVRGSLAHRPSYGVGIQLYQNSLGSFEKQRQLALEIRKQFLEDPRVISVDSIRVDNDKDGQYVIKYKVTGIGVGTFEATAAPFGDFSL